MFLFFKVEAELKEVMKQLVHPSCWIALLSNLIVYKYKISYISMKYMKTYEILFHMN